MSGISKNIFDEINKYSNKLSLIKDLLKDFRTYTLDYKISETLSLEYLMLLSYLRFHGFKEIFTLIDTPFFIFNDSLYFRNSNNTFEEIKLNKLLFISTRWSNWNYSFFHILKELIEKNNGKFVKPNLNNYCIPFKWKLYAIKSLYKYRENYIGDIIIPYKISWWIVNLFIDFVKNKLWNIVLIKQDNTQVGEWIYVCNLNTDDWIKRFKLNLKKQLNYLKEIYIVPYYDFKEEYRVYFIKHKNKVNIYSIKKKEILTDKNEIIKAWTFKYWDVANLKWEYIPNKLWQKEDWLYYNIYKKACEYINLLDYETWSLEFGLTKDWKYIFFEVNWMSDPICLTDEDIENMTKYYMDLFDYMIYHEK